MIEKVTEESCLEASKIKSAPLGRFLWSKAKYEMGKAEAMCLETASIK